MLKKRTVWAAVTFAGLLVAVVLTPAKVLAEKTNVAKDWIEACQKDNRIVGFLGTCSIDAVTVDLRDGDCVRLLGVAQPDNALLVEEAVASLTSWVYRQRCHITWDANIHKDSDGTPLGYVIWESEDKRIPLNMRASAAFGKETLLNEEMLRRGLGTFKHCDGMSEEYAKVLKKAEQDARDNKRGIWWLKMPPKLDERRPQDAALKNLWEQKVPFTAYAFLDSVEDGNAALVRLFLTAGMPPDTKFEEGETMLMKAASRTSTETLKLLLDARKDKADRAKLQDMLTAAATAGVKDNVLALLETGADINGRDQNGFTCLSEVLLEDNVPNRMDMIKMLIEHKADVNAASAEGWTPLMIAAASKTADDAKVLINAGADVNANNGETALIRAVVLGSLDTVNLLVASGANVNATDSDGYTALTRARAMKKKDIADAIVKAGGKGPELKAAKELPPLIAAILNGRQDEAKKMITAGADIEATAEDGSTALMGAAALNQPQIVKLLLDKGANINAKATSGVTVLMCAAMAGDKKIVTLLLEKGADIRATDIKGFTALKWADTMGHAAVVELLKAAEKH